MFSTDIQNLNAISYQLFPNPVADQTTLSFKKEDNSIYTLSIIDMSGRIILLLQNIETKEITIERGNIKSGVYIIQLYSESGILVSDKLIFK